MAKQSDKDMRNEGITLLQNACKARSMAEPLLDAYLSNSYTNADKNWGCYMLQQSIELSLKGLIKYFYSDFREGHLVSTNANILLELSNCYFELNEIQESLYELRTKFAGIILKWESMGRYKDLRVKRLDVEKAIELVDDLMSFIRRHNFNEDV